MTYVITLHGVLQQPNGAPNPQGLALYSAFADVTRLVVLGGLDKMKDEWFLATHNLTDHVEFIPEHLDKGWDEKTRRMAQIGALRAKGTVVDLVVEPNPEIVAEMHEQGIPTLLYLHPRFSQPAFRPDYESVATPWAQLIKTVTYQEVLKASQVLLAPSEEDDEESE